MEMGKLKIDNFAIGPKIGQGFWREPRLRETVGEIGPRFSEITPKARRGCLNPQYPDPPVFSKLVRIGWHIGFWGEKATILVSSATNPPVNVMARNGNPREFWENLKTLIILPSVKSKQGFFGCETGLRKTRFWELDPDFCFSPQTRGGFFWPISGSPGFQRGG